MTKPTGRPRGRPKTKDYFTLMARVPQDLADRVQHYARLHQQPISVVLRDGLELLLEEDRYRPFVSDMKGDLEIVSNAKEGQASIVSDVKEEMPPRMSDRTTTPSALLSDEQAALSHIESYIKEDSSSLVPENPVVQSSILYDNNLEASNVPAQPLQPLAPEPEDQDSVEWRRWAVLEQVRTAQVPSKPADIARQVGSTSALVRSDLEYWRKQGSVYRQDLGGYVYR
jgi:hypothetical protein